MYGGRNKARIRGFTVLELVLVMALISLLVGYVLPSFWGAFQAEALPTSARDLRALLYQVRANAMMEGLRYRVRFPAEGEFEDQPERHYHPLVEREARPVEEPGIFAEVQAAWAREPVLRNSVRCVKFQLGMPRVPEQLDEMTEAPTETEEQKEQELDELWEVQLYMEPDGSSDWATFRLAWLRTNEEEENPEEAPTLNVMIDGRTGAIWVQQPLTEEEIELLLRENGSHILHTDRINAPPITEENILRLRDLL